MTKFSTVLKNQAKTNKQIVNIQWHTSKAIYWFTNVTLHYDFEIDRLVCLHKIVDINLITSLSIHLSDW